MQFAAQAPDCPVRMRTINFFSSADVSVRADLRADGL
jgi:hypothetical protein